MISALRGSETETPNRPVSLREILDFTCQGREQENSIVLKDPLVYKTVHPQDMLKKEKKKKLSRKCASLCIELAEGTESAACRAMSKRNLYYANWNLTLKLLSLFC